MQRRTFLSSTLAAPLAAAAAPAQEKKIAAVITTYFPNSHADVVIGKYLEGYTQDNRGPRPASRLVSMFTAQVPKDDLSRPMAAKYNVPIYRTAYEALTMGTGKLAVDGVLLIGEHGNYPMNDKAQTLYPRFELFLEITDVFRQSRRSVPVFNDKHLSFSYIKAKRMVEISHELKFPMMAGSSIPGTFRSPQVDLEWGAPARRAVAISYSGLDIYGFHLLECLQCVVERRKGGETGIRAVRCLERDDVWKYLDATPWAKRLFERALTHSKTRVAGDVRTLAKTPAVFVLEYSDGLEAAAFLLTGAVSDFTIAVDVDGQAEPLSTLMWLEEKRPYWHFEQLVRNIEKMFQTGVPVYPVERTLLTSSTLDMVLESRFQGYKRLETPQLAIRYQAPRESLYAKGMPPRA